MPTQIFFYCYFLCMGFLCFVWPPITQHGWQTPQRFHAASPHSQTEFHPVCRQLGPRTRCSIRLLCSSRSLMFLFLVSCLFFIKLKGVSIIQSIAFFLCVFSLIKHLIFSWWVLHPLLINSHCINTNARLVARVIASICVIYVCRFRPRFTAPALGEMKHLSPLTLVDPRSLFNQWRHNSQHHYHPSNRTQRILSHSFALCSLCKQEETVHH